jgi:hypothetical protein
MNKKLTVLGGGANFKIRAKSEIEKDKDLFPGQIRTPHLSH